jgi:hypothetical protein
MSPHLAEVDLRFLSRRRVLDAHGGRLLSPRELGHREATEGVVARLQVVITNEQRVHLGQAERPLLGVPSKPLLDAAVGPRRGRWAAETRSPWRRRWSYGRGGAGGRPQRGHLREGGGVMAAARRARGRGAAGGRPKRGHHGEGGGVMAAVGPRRGAAGGWPKRGHHREGGGVMAAVGPRWGRWAAETRSPPRRRWSYGRGPPRPGPMRGPGGGERATDAAVGVPPTPTTAPRR